MAGHVGRHDRNTLVAANRFSTTVQMRGQHRLLTLPWRNTDFQVCAASGILLRRNQTVL